ncbi:MAG: GGDEF domain-containing protein [Planctomycetes bacterium]|nr:GGDEF domain-containing protein [Planctomycetota bacterium]MBU4400784.1 GGDEF domain-containing protein [Planctomycetota bacterium]MCG2685376.1 GGDEF domain-containing protein [Planctomycetales bacterium]
MPFSAGSEKLEGRPFNADCSATATSAEGCWPGTMQTAFDLLPDAVFRLDGHEMTFSGANRAACERLGYTREELFGMGLRQVCRWSDIAALARRLDDLGTEAPATAVFHTVLRRKNGKTVAAEWRVSRIPECYGGGWIVAASVADRTDGLYGANADSLGLGLPGHDPLTGLPDRRLFERLLDRALDRVRRRGDYLFAVCFIDLDGFKTINDRLGHLAGDRVLCEIARRLVGCVRPGDMAARFGGDEFTVLIDDLPDGRSAELVARRMLDQIRRPIAIDDHSVRIGASVGVAIGSGECRRIENLLHDADGAMYRVKSLGGDEVGLFNGNDSFRPVKPR